LIDSESMPITSSLALKVQEKIQKYFEKNGAHLLYYADDSDEFAGGMKRNLQIDGSGNVNLYTKWINHPSRHAYLSNEVLINGKRDLWTLDSPIVRDIKDIFKGFKMLLERDELQNEAEKITYVKDAIFSRFMERKTGALLFREMYSKS